MPGGTLGTVVVIGGGCSGVLTAAHLLRRAERPVDVVIVEAHGRLGHGIAYGTSNPEHLLNTRAGDMSAFGDVPDDFVSWARGVGCDAHHDDYLPRSLYGSYLEALIDRVMSCAHPLSGIEVLRAEAVAIAPRVIDDHHSLVVGLADGGHVIADEVVLALGVPPPSARWSADIDPEVDPEVDRRIIGDPWRPGALEAVPPDGDVLLVGTGLTMVDVALELSVSGRCRRLYARSRRGLLPLSHLPGPRATSGVDVLDLVGEREQLTARAVLRAARQAAEKTRAEGADWRASVAQLREHAPMLWSCLSPNEQARLLRHAVRYWEIHRHRLAPEVARRVDSLVDTHVLGIARGQVEAIEPQGSRLRVHLRRHREREQLVVDAIVNCSGPGRDYAGGSRLVDFLLASELARRGPHGLGLDVDEHGALISALTTNGVGVHAIGWARRGHALESTSVPEIRNQARDLAERLREPLATVAV